MEISKERKRTINKKILTSMTIFRLARHFLPYLVILRVHQDITELLLGFEITTVFVLGGDSGSLGWLLDGCKQLDQAFSME